MAPKFTSTLGPILSQNWLFIVLVVIKILLYKKYGAMAFHDEDATLIYVPLVLRLFSLRALASTKLNLRPLACDLVGRVA